MNMTLRHIDNSFFRLSIRQARALCASGNLPKPGRETMVGFDDLANVKLEFRAGDRAVTEPVNTDRLRSAFVTRTIIAGNTVWALRLHFAI